ncbi:hypothetical protein FHG87_002186 [Trinorchestia longiramus]|nr:hypothetical protein FHG87_002186 [Trinorchestia longiramus]
MQYTCAGQSEKCYECNTPVQIPEREIEREREREKERERERKREREREREREKERERDRKGERKRERGGKRNSWLHSNSWSLDSRGSGRISSVTLLPVTVILFWAYTRTKCIQVIRSFNSLQDEYLRSLAL